MRYKCPAGGINTLIEVKQKAYKNNILKNVMALRILQQSMSKVIYLKISDMKKVNEVRKVIKMEFKGSQKVISIKL
ncbi:hypothetical protein MLD38_018781 [Melastoma candidum]|uniref:Uncharacterized protein n=1 Tax=Melastoma candidum TaxID=119954 RepID=A0ACB9QW77_9MYRT|nr:hypothetical protein MLD38_018781 [Melastoma candidum]